MMIFPAAHNQSSADVLEGIADELMSSFDLKWQHLTLSRQDTQVVEGAWSTIKRQVVNALGPSGFSLLARAREMMDKKSLEFTVEEVSELMVAMELGATVEQRRALQPVLDHYRQNL